jgi:hypothetical protein
MTLTHPGGKTLPPLKQAYLHPTEKNNYKSYIDVLREFQKKKGVTRGKDTIAGRETVRFRFEEEIELGTLTTTLWVDVKTDLPVREHVSLSDKSGTTTEWLKTDYEWDPELPKGFKSLDELFSTKPPEGYKVEDKTQKD